jgi:HK97 family phage prohead protease
MNRAYSIFEVKSVDDEQRFIRGIATTPTPDRLHDVVVPGGGKMSLPLPLLYQHDAKQPIGHVVAADVTDAGISITAQIAKGVAPYIDEAWSLIKAGLVRGLSIGFRPTKDPTPIKGTHGLRFGDWELLEISAVTIPANEQATILTVKQFDLRTRAAPGQIARKGVPLLARSPGASGPIAGHPGAVKLIPR